MMKRADDVKGILAECYNVTFKVPKFTAEILNLFKYLLNLCRKRISGFERIFSIKYPQ